MNVGMLWLDSEKNRTFEEKVRRGAEYYTEKYGIKPTICQVNLLQYSGYTQVGSVRIEAANNILKHHFWFGVENSE